MKIMKTALMGCCVALVFSAMSASSLAATIATWTFETSVPTTAGPHAAEVGVGSATGFHASASTVYSNPAGNGSLESFSSNFWAIGDYYQFQVSTLGLEDLSFSWHQTRSSTGPSGFNLQYSTDGSTFTNFTGYVVPSISWSSATPDATNTTVFSQDLSSITALDNDPSIFFRLTATSAAGGTAGSNRVDNISIAASEIPEPASIALMFASMGALFVCRR